LLDPLVCGAAVLLPGSGFDKKLQGNLAYRVTATVNAASA
jgi:hypothetical protein